jgi:predicted acetyltransferase
MLNAVKEPRPPAKEGDQMKKLDEEIINEFIALSEKDKQAILSFLCTFRFEQATSIFPGSSSPVKH